MKAPLNRDQQIELMTNAKERHEARMQRWLSDAQLREAFSQPAPGQVGASPYTRKDEKVACCG